MSGKNGPDMTEPREIFRRFPPDCQPSQIEAIGNAGGLSGAQFWRTITPRGVLLLRRWPTEHPDHKRLQFIHATLFHAANKGLDFLPLPIESLSGHSFVKLDGHLWELSPWLPGTADFARSPTREKLRAAMVALARFHLATSDNVTKAFDATHCGDRDIVTAPQRHFTRLRGISPQCIQELRGAAMNGTWAELAPLAHRFLAEFPAATARAIEHLAPIASSQFQTQPCIRDIWHDHILFTGNVVTGIVDFGAMGVDTPATDLARLLGSLVGNNRVAWQEGLDDYATIRALTDTERMAAYALNISGTVLAGLNWIRWTFVENRQFENCAQIVERFRRITDLLTSSTQ
jgi:Ser/Thr protein kinase RdoA (MazF antagonist)